MHVQRSITPIYLLFAISELRNLKLDPQLTTLHCGITNSQNFLIFLVSYFCKKLLGLLFQYPILVKACAIVDAYSSGSLLAPEFQKRGYRVLHVRSKEYASSLMAHSLHIEDFELDIPPADPSIQAHELRVHGVEFIIAGAECGVELADTLNDLLELPGNDSSSSLIRRSKYEMVEAIRQAGLRTARQIKTASILEALAFAKTVPSGFVVLKPQRSTGSDLVFQAKTTDDISLAFKKIMSSYTMFGEPNELVCVQEFLEGEEFIVDTVSCDGVPVVTDVWRYHLKHQKGAPFLYDYTELLDYSDPYVAPLEEYGLNLLKTLNITWGPAHAEVMFTKSGPVVVEVGARLAGAKFPIYAEAAGGKNQARVAVDAYSNRLEFCAELYKSYSLSQQCVLVSLISSVKGQLRGLPRIADVEKLSSFWGADMWVQKGDRLQQTVDVATGPGIIALIHPDRSVIEQDYRTIREWESDGFYEVDPI